jgi:hypothetical protein
MHVIRSSGAAAAVRAVIVTAGVAAAVLAPHAAFADIGGGNPVAIGFGTHPALLPTLHATISSEQGSYSFAAKGYFKISGKTVARLPSFAGRADSTALSHMTLTVSHATRHIIRAAAKRRGAHRTTLTITIKATDSSGRVGNYSQDAFLTIPRG